MSTISVGNESESAVMFAYIKAGFHVSIPFGNGCPYNLVVDTGARLLKIQVKTAWQHNGHLIYQCQRRIKDAKQNGMRRYSDNEVDFFAVHFPLDGSIYVVPFWASGGRGCLRLNPALNGQRKMIRWAADYKWETHIEMLRQDGPGTPAPVLSYIQRDSQAASERQARG